MHILKLPSWFPMDYAPYKGVFIKEQASALEEKGLDIGVIYPNLRRLSSVTCGSNVINDRFQTTINIEDGIPVYRYRAWNPGNSRLRMWAFSRLSHHLMNKYVQKFGCPDLIHGHSVKWGGIACKSVADKWGLPYVITEHSSAFKRGKIGNWKKPYIKEAFDDAKRVWAVSTSQASSLQKYIGHSRLDVMPNMVDTDFFRKPPSSRDQSIFTFLAIANDSPNKGLPTLLKAFSAVVDRVDDVELIIVGVDSSKQRLSRRAYHLGINNKIVIKGKRSRPEVRQAMWDANALVSSSYVETFGVVLIEAMATGLPVVSTRSGGPEDIINPSVGKIVPVGDCVALANGMKDIIYEKFTPHKIRKYVQQSYGNRTVAGRIISEYRRVLS